MRETLKIRRFTSKVHLNFVSSKVYTFCHWSRWDFELALISLKLFICPSPRFILDLVTQGTIKFQHIGTVPQCGLVSTWQPHNKLLPAYVHRFHQHVAINGYDAASAARLELDRFQTLCRDSHQLKLLNHNPKIVGPKISDIFPLKL